jgi:anti-sigma B factor antagonist
MLSAMRLPFVDVLTQFLPNPTALGAVGQRRYNPTIFHVASKEPHRIMELEIQTERSQGLCEVALNGEIDVYTAPKLKAELVGLIDAGCTNVVVDLENVSFIDSSGLGVLVSALRRAHERDGAVRLLCTRDNILKIFHITGLDKVFPVFSDPVEARKF